MTRLQRITSGFRLEIGAASGRHVRDVRGTAIPIYFPMLSAISAVFVDLMKVYGL